MIPIPATWMRGGTSKCWVFRKEDLEVPGRTVDEVLLGLYGSPDLRQVDGVGGGTSTTSKAVILSPASDDEVDVDYTFAQVGIGEAVVDWGSNCGNCSAVVAAFAVLAGWVPADEVETTVRVRNTNTGQIIVQHVPTPGGVLDETPTTAIPGVSTLGAPVRLGFVDPAGRSTGRLFPSGAPVDVLDDLDDEARGVRATLVDAGAPVVAVSAADLGLTGTESPAELDARPELLARLDVLRREGAVRMGMVASPEQAARAVPKLAIVAPGTGGSHLTVRMLSMGTVHPALPITGSVALTLAAATPESLVAQLLQADAGAHLDISTPAGVVSTYVERDRSGAQVVGVTRTYRRLSEGVAFLPEQAEVTDSSLQDPADTPGDTPLTTPIDPEITR